MSRTAVLNTDLEAVCFWPPGRLYCASTARYKSVKITSA